MSKLSLIYNLYKNQGGKYLLYRTAYELASKTGILKVKFPSRPSIKQFISLDDWRKSRPAFFFNTKADLQFEKQPNPILKEKFEQFRTGNILYFNETYTHVGSPIDWLTNTSTGHRYSNKIHWTAIDDFSTEAGDIKYVWEKSRFSFFIDLIRYDYHFDKDCGELVFSTLDSWIEANPLNQGPNYKCSQETSLRLLHWIFALYYYADHKSLTDVRFGRIMHSIYWQLHHVRKNISFSRICVRNNHAITEVMILFFSGLLFPFMPDTIKWKSEGKKWLEEEIAYQVYNDGTFLQFSHNYERVLMQLLTWSQILGVIHGEKFSETFLSRSRAVVDYIRTVIDPDSGKLPNYGANDGALFFRLNDNTYRDYRPQLNALYFANYGKPLLPMHSEDIHWLSGSHFSFQPTVDTFLKKAIGIFSNGGIYTIRDAHSFTFIKCASYNDRPSHADGLHMDLWYQGQNVLRDPGTFKYNTNAELTSYFTGTRSHNTVTLGDYDQMRKAQRFIWFDWTEAITASLVEDEEYIIFNGAINAFQYLKKGIVHHRVVRKKKNASQWIIEDLLNDTAGHQMKQWWHPGPSFFDHFSIKAFDELGNEITAHHTPGHYSHNYGVIESTHDICFVSKGNKINTHISLNESTN